MRFVCKHCGSKYTIADEKVRSKILKIRCKKCDSIIEVRDARSSIPPPRGAPTKKKSKPPSSVLEGKFAESFRPKKSGASKGTPGLFEAVKHSAEILEQKETDHVQWFVAIDDNPRGPMPASKVHSHRRVKQVDDGSLVWKEGMTDWVPLRNCKELVGLLARLDLDLGQIETEEEKAKQAHPKLGLFAEQEAPDKSPLKGRSIGLIGDRIDVPPEEKSQESSSPAPEATASNEPSFGRDDFGDLDDLSLDTYGTVGSIQTLAPPRAVNSYQNRLYMLTAVGFFVIAVVTLGIALFGGGGSGETITVKTVEKVIEKVVYRDRLAEEAVNITDSPAVETAKKVKHGSKSRRVSKGDKARSKEGDKPKVDAKTQELMKRLGLSAPTGSAPIGSRTKRVGTSKGAATGSLSPNQVKSVVDRNKSRLKSCYERALKVGEAPEDKDIRVDFKLVVGSSGMVKRTVITGDGARIPTLKGCLSRSVRKWVFPQSSGDSPVEFPFLFTPR